MNIKKGDTVFIKAQRESYEAVVTSVGNKYITIGSGYKFRVSDGYGEFGHQLYESKDVYDLEIKTKIANQQLRKDMEFMKLTLAQVEAIRNIIHN